MKKKVLVGIMILFFVFSSVFAEGSSEKQENVVELKLPHPDTIAGSLNMTTEFFAQKAEEYSGGKIKIKVFPAGQLGNHDELAEACALGNMPLVKLTIGVITHYDENMNILDLPFLFKNEDHVAAAMESAPVQQLFKEFTKETGMRILAMYGSGFQGFYSKKPIRNIEDIQGMTMRVMNSPARISSMEAYGALAVNVPWPEAYAAFQQGVADGGENSIPLVLNSKQYEVLPNFTISNHFWSGNAIVINEKYFQSLSEDLQAALIKAGKEAVPYNRKNYEAELLVAKIELENKGVQFSTLTNDERNEFVKRIYPIWNQFTTKPLHSEILQEIERLGEKMY